MKYDSKFEQQLHRGALRNFLYHPFKRSFTITYDYTPDFGIEVGKYTYFMETKGYLYSGHAARKYTEFKKSLKEHEELIFIFQKPSVQLKWKSRKVDGTKMTMYEWADVNCFRWYTEDTLCVLLNEINIRTRVYNEAQNNSV